MAELNDNKGETVERLRSRQMELILSQMESLPTLPSVAARLLSLTASSRSDTEEVIRLLRADQSLTAKLLSLASRASSGIRREARTIEKVVLMLGFDAVRSAVLSIKVFEMFGQSGQAESGLNRIEFWKHCLAVASASEAIAQRLKLPLDNEEVFVCGLLHDLGKLAFEQALPKSYARVVDAAERQFGNIADFERHVLGMDHTILGRRLAQVWHLPPLIEQVIWLHHQPPEAIPEGLTCRPVVAVVQLADAIVREQRFGYSGNHTFPRTPRELAENLGLTDQQLKEIIAEIPRAIQQRAEILGLEDMTSEGVLREALSSANAELGRLNEALRRRAGRLAEQARAASLLREFNSALTAQSRLDDLCRQMARTWAKVGSFQPSLARPVVAYAVSQEDRAVVAAAHNGGEEPLVIILPLRAEFPPEILPGSLAPAENVLPLLLPDQTRWRNWLGGPALVHRGLVCGGAWVGGLLWSVEENNDTPGGEAGDAVAVGMSFAAASMAARDSANALAEQLTQATQKLYASQQALAEARSLSAVGEMAAGAAHEINNPLAIVVGRAELMAESAKEADRATWQTMAEQAQRISDIVTALMEFARPNPPKPEAIDVGELVSSARARLEQAGTPAPTVEVSLPKDLPAVQVDPRQIGWVVGELLANAAAAAGAEKCQVRIEADVEEISDRVLVKFTDNGPGMDAATLSNAFTPFFSAKPAGRSRGLGLSKARRLIELNGGKVWMKSQPGEGTTVFVLLPRSRSGPSNATVSP